MDILSINPHNLEVNRKIPETSSSEILRIVEKVSKDQQKWKGTTIQDRIVVLKNLSTNLRNNLEFHAKTITSEMGKPITEARGEIEKCAILCDYYASISEEALQGRTIKTKDGVAKIEYDPLGIVLAIMPWNFPYWQVFRAAIPAIMAGNAIVLKHASNTTLCSLTIETLFQSSSYPMNLFRAIPVSGKNSAILIAHPLISAVTFTGSNEAGEKIAGMAGTQIKKTVLELGGSDPSIVLEDADIDRAVQCCVVSRMLNAGQSCIAAKRILVHKKIIDSFVDKAKKQIEEIVVGDPLSEETNMGPLATESILNEIQTQVDESINMGAICLTGGQKLKEMCGHYYSPTLLTDVTPLMPVWKEETFGPVMCVTAFSDENEAISLANLTEWGLGASVYSKNIDKALEIAKKINTGTCTINDFVKSDPKVPFGGVKKSGFGRELSTEGLIEFTNTKAYNISQ